MNCDTSFLLKPEAGLHIQEISICRTPRLEPNFTQIRVGKTIRLKEAIQKKICGIPLSVVQLSSQMCTLVGTRRTVRIAVKSRDSIPLQNPFPYQEVFLCRMSRLDPKSPTNGPVTNNTMLVITLAHVGSARPLLSSDPLDFVGDVVQLPKVTMKLNLLVHLHNDEVRHAVRRCLHRLVRPVHDRHSKALGKRDLRLSLASEYRKERAPCY